MAQALSIQRLEELQTWAEDTVDETPIEERGWCLDIADALGELIARRRVEVARNRRRAPFTLEYQEGWAVFQCDDGHLEIQRLDCPSDAVSTNPGEPMFASDDEAIAYVRRCAEQGSRYHREALALHEAAKDKRWHDDQELRDATNSSDLKYRMWRQNQD